MADDDAYIEGNLGTEVPQQIRPRDHQGKFIPNRTPEPMFATREMEGTPAPETDEDRRYAEHERRIADGRDDEGEGREPAKNRQDLRRTPDNAEDDDEGSDLETVGGDDDASEVQEPEDDGEKYEIIVDGKNLQVSLQEALRGYIRQETFHKRMSQLQELQNGLEVEAARIQQNWGIWHKAKQDYDEDIANMMPKEPNWDQEFAQDPRAAHEKQKIYAAVYARLAQSRDARLKREAEDATEQDRRVKQFAIMGFNQFVSENKLEDEAVRKKELQSMRRTALAAGFSEQELATTYDPRMLNVLRKASRYDRITANRPKAVQPSKGKTTLTPGAATPLGGNARRSGLDEAQRNLARSGRLDDAAEWFRRQL